MSTALAIAAAARAIASLLDDRVADEGLAVFQNHRTSVLSPDQIDTQNGAPATQLNLFPYHVGFNAAWRNTYHPARDATGRALESPPLTVDISFLLSAHSGNPYHSEILLGLGMQALHDNPQLSRDRVRSLLRVPPGPPPPEPVLVAIDRSRLANQFELVRIVPLNLPAAEMQNLWTALHGRYRPSFCYQVSAIIIDSRVSGRVGLPVREVASTVVQFVRPYIDRIEPSNVVFSTGGNTITLIGTQLAQTGFVARFRTGQRRPLAAGSTDERGLLALPGDLRAGIIGVELVRPVEIGAPPAKDINESNLAIFIHQPVFRQAAGGGPDIALGAIDNSTQPPHRPLRVRLQPAPERDQEVKLMLNERVAGAAGRGFTFPGEIGQNPAADPVTFRLVGVPAGTYLLRVRVDGADTPLDTDAAGTFSGPAIQV